MDAARSRPNAPPGSSDFDEEVAMCKIARRFESRMDGVEERHDRLIHGIRPLLVRHVARVINDDKL